MLLINNTVPEDVNPKLFDWVKSLTFGRWLEIFETMMTKQFISDEPMKEYFQTTVTSFSHIREFYSNNSDSLFDGLCTLQSELQAANKLLETKKRDAQIKSEVTTGYIRISMGIENIEDILIDIDQALST